MSAKKILSLPGYDIVFDGTLQVLREYLEHHKYTSITILTDENTREFCLPEVKNVLSSLTVEHISIHSGEQNKNLEISQLVWQSLLKLEVDRKGVLINLGGGVIGDLGGFAAACYKRGIDFIQVPTTLLSQVDASVGGKLGVDFQYGKNIIGLFKNPALVLVNTGFLDTLSERQRMNGFAEIFKHALIRDASQWEILKRLDDLSHIKGRDLEDLVYASVKIKKLVVEEDPFEKHLRKILNFGHTLGHAVEAFSLAHDREPLLHGEAVAVGMIMEAYLSFRHSGLSEEHLHEIGNVLFRHYKSYDLAATDEELWKYLVMDKKNLGGKVLAVLLKKPGEPVIDVEITPADVAGAVQYYRALANEHA